MKLNGVEIFERALKSMTCVQIGSIHIDGFKNVKKKSKWYSVAMVTNQNPQKGQKMSSRRPKYLKLEK